MQLCICFLFFYFSFRDIFTYFIFYFHAFCASCSFCFYALIWFPFFIFPEPWPGGMRAYLWRFSSRPWNAYNFFKRTSLWTGIHSQTTSTLSLALPEPVQPNVRSTTLEECDVVLCNTSVWFLFRC